MLKDTIRTIAINPGTRYLGIAIFSEWNLLDWGVKRIDGKWSKKKIDKILALVSDCIECHDLNTLIIKSLHPAHSSRNLRLLVSRIKTLARRKKLKVCQFSIRQVEEIFLADAKLNKRNLAEKLVTHYPYLVHELGKEKAHRNPYHLRMFEAVALGAGSFQKQN